MMVEIPRHSLLPNYIMLLDTVELCAPDWQPLSLCQTHTTRLSRAESSLKNLFARAVQWKAELQKDFVNIQATKRLHGGDEYHNSHSNGHSNAINEERLRMV